MENITFIYAGAGSGKTHKLTSLLIQNIKDKIVSADEVLLTTFTKKAAVEIKERAQQELLKNRLFEDSSKLNKAFIGTVHSVGYKFIQKYYYLLGLSPEIRELGDNEKEIFFAQAISEIPNEEELDKLNDLVLEFNFQKENTFDSKRWVSDVKNLMELALTNQINLSENDSSLNHSLEIQSSIFDASLSLANLQTIITNNINIIRQNPVNNKKYDALIEFIDKIPNINDQQFNKISTFHRLDDLLSKMKDTYSANRYQPILNQIQDYDISKTFEFQDRVSEYTQLIFSLAGRSLHKYKEFKKEKGLIDFTDMEVNFLTLLNFDEVKEDLAHSLKIVMVDEFQDSNPIQLAIFMKLSKLVKHSYWVGDPKQSIYGFRGSDPVLIDAVMDCFTQQNTSNLNVELLKMSWRSNAELVNFSNVIFRDALYAQISDIYLNNRDQINGKEDDEAFRNWKTIVNIHPIEGTETISLFPARGIEEQVLGLQPLNLANFLQEAANGFKAATNEQFFHMLAAKVKGIIENENIQIFDKQISGYRRVLGSDICFLVNSNSNVSQIATEFQKSGLEVNALTPGLTNTIEYRFVKNIAILLLEKYNALAKTELVFLNGDVTDWKDLIKKRIDLFLYPNVDEENLKEQLSNWLEEFNFNEVLRSFQTSTKHLSISNVIRLIINQFNLFFKVSSFGKTAARQSNLMQLIELAEEYEESSLKLNIGTSLNGFINFIESSSINDTQKGAKSKDAIQVMTYHKSKGLEWPIVFLMSLDNNVLSDFFSKRYFKTNVINQGDFEIHNPLSNRVIEFLWWPFGTKKSPNESLQIQLENTDAYHFKRNQALNESKRLFYVGVTRARDVLFLTSNKNKTLSWLENVIQGFNYENTYNELNLSNVTQTQIDLFSNGNMIHFSQQIFSGYELSDVDYEPFSYFEKVVPLSQESPYDLQPSKVPPLANLNVEEIAQVHERLNFKNTETVILGNSLHAMLYAKNKPYFQTNVKLINEANNLGLDCEKFISNTENFEKFIQSNFNPIKQYHEFYLEKEINQQGVKGEADLVLELENELVLIDYKSFPGKTSEIYSTTSDFCATKYSGQLALYSNMLESYFNKPIKKKMIYYVVQGVLIELK